MSELSDAIERNKNISYGRFLIGDWLCLDCGKSYTPTSLVMADKKPPFTCECGEELIYDEAM